VVLVGGAGVEGSNAVCGDAKTLPVSRLTSRGDAALPEKYSDAESAASEDCAGGKMSDWKESAYEKDGSRSHTLGRVGYVLCEAR
jgi:hypothetical protein